MAQIPSARSAKNYQVEWTTNATTYIDISGYSTTVADSGGDRKTGEAYTYGDDIAVIGEGKRSPRTVDVTVLYNEDSTAYTSLYTLQQSGATFGLRLTPRGLETGAGTIGRYLTQTTYGLLQKLDLPTGNSDDGKPMVCKMTVMTPTVTTATTSI